MEDPAKSLLAKKRMWEGMTFLHTAENMEALALELGIALRETDKFFYPRDCFLLLADGSIRMPYFSQQLQTAVERTHSSNLYLDQTGATRTKNQLFNGWTGYSRLFTQESCNTYRNIFQSDPLTFAYTYVEGGNTFSLTNREGVLKVLIGRDHLTETLHLLDLEQRPWDELAKETYGQPLSTLREELTKSLTPGEWRKLAEEMFSEGLLLQAGRSGLIDRKQQLNLMMIKFMTGAPTISREERGWLRKLGVQTGIIPQFVQPSDSDKMAIATYLSKKAITHRLMAKDFKVSPENVHFITQVNYHLDLFLRPGPNSSIFLLNFAFCKDLLDALSQTSLSEMDREHLQRYMETAAKFDLELGPLLKEVEKELEQAGFTVIPMPGYFLYESKTMYKEFPMPSEGWNINFINALSGWSPRTGKQYYITHGLQVGDQLGDLIMDMFVFFMHGYLPGLELYFIGRNPSNLADFSEAMDWWNRLETGSGIHCATFELSKSSPNLNINI